MKRIKKVGLVLLASALLFSTGCQGSYGNIPGPVSTMETEQMPLFPEAPGEQQRQYTLYFGLEEETYLASEARLVNVPQGGRVEDALVAALIKGPGVSQNKLVRVINPKTRIVCTEENRDYLYITLSRDFLEPVLPSGEENLSVQRQKELQMLMMQLGTYSIVNTVTELGRYSRVQILIDLDGSGEGTRPTRAMLGFAPPGDGEAGNLVGILSRMDDMILNPMNTLDIILEAFVEKDWNRVEAFCAVSDPQTDTPRPAKESFVNQLTLRNPQVLGYAIKSEHVAVDGRSATVLADIQLHNAAGAAVNHQDIPLRLLREDGIWKLSYASLELLCNTIG